MVRYIQYKGLNFPPIDPEGTSDWSFKSQGQDIVVFFTNIRSMPLKETIPFRISHMAKFV